MWQKTLTLNERCVLMHRPAGDEAYEQAVMRGRERLQQWQTSKVLDDEAILSTRLQADGLTEDDFCFLLGAPADLAGANQAPPAWFTMLKQAYASDCPKSVEPLVVQEPQLGFVQPLIGHAFSRFDEGIMGLQRQHEELPFDPEHIRDIMQPNLIVRLKHCISLTLVLQVNIERLRGRLEGETPEARYQFFMHTLQQPEYALDLLHEYPVLGRLAMAIVDRWTETSLEFLQRLCADWSLIKTQFTRQEPGLLSAVESVGDPHFGGRSVAIVHFASGFKIIYKPRSMRMAVHFQALLAWLNARGSHLPFRTLEVADLGDYGWMEYVVATPCTSGPELRRFYRRLGGLIAVLHTLAADDCHYENLIAAADDPVLVDLESLFQPYIKRQLPAIRLRRQSVMNLGILPNRMPTTPYAEGVDLSGMANPKGTLYPSLKPTLEQDRTDHVRSVKKCPMITNGNNVPVPEGTDVNLHDYLDDVMGGFRELYALLIQERDNLLAPHGPIQAFAQDQVRVLIRATRVYGTLHHSSFHSAVLRDALERDLLFDSLWHFVEKRPEIVPLIAAEQDDLRQGDIPCFTTTPVSRHLWTSPGHCVEDFFDETGLQAVQKRLTQYGAADLARQLWAIRSAITAASSLAPSEKRRGYPVDSPVVAPERDTLMALACQAGDRLEALAFREGDIVSWTGLTVNPDGLGALLPVGLHLYDGLAGITYFLAYLGAITGITRYTALAAQGLATIRESLTYPPFEQRFMGAFSGLSGLVYLYTHLGVLWQRVDLFDAAEGLVPQIEAMVKSDQRYDIMYGAAGAIPCLEVLCQHHPSASALALARACGEHLLAHAETKGPGLGWIDTFSGQALTGFSHGAAGIAWALLKLAKMTGEDHFREAALAALSYERNLFNAAVGNWPDLRQPDPAPPGQQFRVAWCHGAAGIGLSRLGMLPDLDDDVIRREITVAIDTTIRGGFGLNHSLCHGDLGNLELLLVANRTRCGDHSDALLFGHLPDVLHDIASRVLGSLQAQGWRCGTPLGVEIPDLMRGLAGIGYQLMRLAEPNRVPSVLLLAPPHAGSGNPGGLHAYWSTSVPA